MSLVEAAASGDRLAALKELRDTLASAIVSTESGRDVAALSRQLTEVLEQIDKVEGGQSTGEVSVLDIIISGRIDKEKPKAQTRKPTARKPAAKDKG